MADKKTEVAKDSNTNALRAVGLIALMAVGVIVSLSANEQSYAQWAGICLTFGALALSAFI